MLLSFFPHTYTCPLRKKKLFSNLLFECVKKVGCVMTFSRCFFFCFVVFPINNSVRATPKREKKNKWRTKCWKQSLVFFFVLIELRQKINLHSQQIVLWTKFVILPSVLKTFNIWILLKMCWTVDRMAK